MGDCDCGDCDCGDCDCGDCDCGNCDCDCKGCRDCRHCCNIFSAFSFAQCCTECTEAVCCDHCGNCYTTPTSTQAYAPPGPTSSHAHRRRYYQQQLRRGRLREALEAEEPQDVDTECKEAVKPPYPNEPPPSYDDVVLSQPAIGEQPSERTAIEPPGTVTTQPLSACV